MDKNDKIIVLNLAVMACQKPNAAYTAEEIVGFAREFETYVKEGSDSGIPNKVVAVGKR